MLKSSLVLLCVITSITAIAQLVPQRKPFHKKDFSKIASKKYTVVFEYETIDDMKVLTGIVEYGAHGLPAAFYEKGTNDNGDSVTTAETIYKFDGNGQLTRESYTDIAGGSTSVNVFTYSKNGRLLKKTSIHIDPTTTLYTYDAAGKLTKTQTMVRMPVLDKDGEPTGKAADFPNERKTYTYDKTGRLKEETVYNLMDTDDSKRWSYKTRWTFNEQNLLTKLEHINSEDKVYSTETYDYDSNNLLVKKTSKLDDDPIKTFVYEYCTTCKQSWVK